jgi:hypothetical protein
MHRILLQPGTEPLVYFVITFAFNCVAGAFDRPHPQNVQQYWLEDRLPAAFCCGGWVALYMFVVLVVDAVLRMAEPRWSGGDLAFYPRFDDAGRWFRVPAARMTFVIGMLCLAAYYARSAIDFFPQSVAAGTPVWPTGRLFTVSMLAWGVCWIADSLARPRRQTIGAAIAYVAMVWQFIAPFERQFSGG